LKRGLSARRIARRSERGRNTPLIDPGKTQQKRLHYYRLRPRPARRCWPYLPWGGHRTLWKAQVETNLAFMRASQRRYAWWGFLQSA